MVDLLRRRDMAEGSAGPAEIPLYPLDGTYILSDPAGSIVISGSHWHISQNASGTINYYQIFAYPEELFKNKTINYKTEITNFNVISGSISSPSIKLGTKGAGDSQIITLFDFTNGNGDYEITHNLTYAYQNIIRLFLVAGWAGPWEAEFDMKFYADDVLIS